MRWPLRLLAVVAALMLPAALLGATPPGSYTPSDRASLAGQFLIATPNMRDPRFEQTVLVMVRHNRDGAFALIINRPVGEQPVGRLMEVFGEKGEGATGTVQVFLGGPVQPERGFILHSSDYRDTTTHVVGTDVAMTSSPEILRAIAGGTGPKKSLFVFGYAGWGPGQLEGELARNSWFTAPLDARLVFDEPRDKLWELAVERRTRDL